MVETVEVPLVHVANLNQRFRMTQEKNDSGLDGCRLDVRGTQAALVDDPRIPQFS